MKVLRGSRRRWLQASAGGLMVAGAAWAQVTSSAVLPPASAVPVLPAAAPVPAMAVPEIVVPSPGFGPLPLPPMVVTAPVPPPKPVVRPIPTEDAKVPAVPAVRITPIESVPAVVVPALTPGVLEPIPPTLDVPPVAVAPAVVVPAAPVKPARPAMAEIISVGPTSVDATLAFQTALGEARAALARVRDYSGHIIHQDRVRGVLQPEQTAELRVRAQPRSIALKAIAPSASVGRELSFVDGRNGNKARVKQAGTYGPLAFASHTVGDPKAAVSQYHSLVDTGVVAVLDRIERALATEAKLRNPVAVTAADFTFANKAVVRYEIQFERPHALRDAARMVVCMDPDTKLPVRLEVYDNHDLREAVSFVNLAVNTGLGDAAFEK